jgi:phosphonate transport system ATP-binding protein
VIYSLQGVAKSYGTRLGAVQSLLDLTFNVRAGERVALIGPSGAGKTTLFRLLNATLRPTRGVLKFEDRDVGTMSGRDLRAMRQRIGTIYQQHQLVPSLSALENTLCGRLGQWSLFHTIRTAIRPSATDRSAALAALESVELTDKVETRADELSGGQQQRLAIARVLMQNPDVILADEPFASLDPALTDSIASLLLGVTERLHRTLVVTLHDVDMAMRYFPRIIALREGRIMFDSPIESVTSEMLSALYAGDQFQPAVRSLTEAHARVGLLDASRAAGFPG